MMDGYVLLMNTTRQLLSLLYHKLLFLYCEEKKTICLTTFFFVCGENRINYILFFSINTQITPKLHNFHT